MQYVYEKGGEGSLKHYIEQLLLGFEWKMVLSVMGAAVAMLEGFYGELMWGFLALFVLDSITGIMKSKKNGVPITSKRLRGAVTKLGAYMVLITALIITSKFESSFVPIVTVTYYYYMFTELKSIVENVGEMGVHVPEFLRKKVEDKVTELDANTTVTQQVTVKEDVVKVETSVESVIPTITEDTKN